ncbi:nucleotidyltransferase domain-containing protein [Candidatus Jorgensenbacteria bacterium]|nr:nucleotidyltransferase domain-containing protein [Candidatus Jorgensenbacteria bacterium]
MSVILSPPPVESIMDMVNDGVSLWPISIITNRDIKSEITIRQNLLGKLTSLFKNIPNVTTSIVEAINSGKVDEEQAAGLYESLADFFDYDPEHARLILYFPFELIPPQTWELQNVKLAIAIRSFVTSYIRAWKTLLKENDVRANFVNGSILEPELSSDGQPMVRKAAHLIPNLVEKSLISIEEVLELVKNYPDETLRNSVADTLPVLFDMSLLSKSDCDNALRTVISFLERRRSYQRLLRLNKIEEAGLLDNLDANIAVELNNIEIRAALDASREISLGRVFWEKVDREEQLIRAYADAIARVFLKDQESSKDILNFFEDQHETISLCAVIRGIGVAIEKIAVKNRVSAKTLVCAHYEKLFSDLYKNGTSKIKDAITQTLLHWNYFDLLTDGLLAELSIVPSQADLSFSERSDFIQNDVHALGPVVELLSSQERFSRFFYPAILLYGSRIKGYAKQEADLDIAVFVKPEILLSQRIQVRETLKEIFPKGKVVEFWLVQKGNSLEVRDFSENNDVTLADPTWAHLLFGGAWLGKEDALRELHKKLLSGFFDLEGREFLGHDARTVLLREFEREVLQYRLMHKGYLYLYPLQGGVSAPHAEDIDAQSTFWDSGYRRLATKLFVERVFLPRKRGRKK